MGRILFLSVLLVGFAAVAFAGPQPGTSPRPNFDPKEVVRRVQRARTGAQAGWEDSGEFLIDTSMYLVSAEALKEEPAVAFDGTNYLVVWNDERSVVAEPDIYGTRVAADGTVLDMAGIAISTAPRGQWFPEVAFDGTNYLVVWQEGNASSWDIRGSRVTVEGEVLEPNGFGVATSPISQWRPDIAFDGNNYLVVWMEEVRYDTFDIYGTRVSSAGVVIDPTVLRICEAPNAQWHPRVTGNPGAGYMVAWQDHRTGFWDAYAARVNTQGAVLDPDGFVVCNTSECFAPDVAFDGTFYLVVWHDERSGDYDIYASRVTTSGVPVDPQGIPVSTAYDDQYKPAVEFDGTSFMILWVDARGSATDIYGSRMTSDGTVLDPGGLRLTSASQGEWHPALVYGGGQYMVTWQQDTRFENREVYVSRMSTAGQMLDPGGKPTSADANSQSWPSVASDGGGFLVAWRDDDRGSGDIFGARVTADGTVLDPAGFAISTSQSSQNHPAVAFGDSGYLVAWTHRPGQSYDIRGAMVYPDGTVGSELEITGESRTQQKPAIAFNGTDFLVAWQDERYSQYFGDIFGTRVSRTGTVLDPGGIEIARDSNAQWMPAVASDGSGFVVVWEDRRTVDQWDVYGARVTAEGTVLDPDGVLLCEADGDQRYPDVTFGGTDYFAVWQNQPGMTPYDIFGARLTTGGTVLDPSGIEICLAEYDQLLPAVAYAGGEYYVAWQHGWQSVWDLNGARVSTGGVVLDTFRVVRKSGDQDYPALAADSAGHLMLAYRGWTGVESGKSFNTFRIWGKMSPLPGITEGAVEVGGSALPATIARGVLMLPAGGNGILHDITGRRVMDLRQGENDIRHLAHGICFVRREEDNSTTKVVIQR
jgi:hypothetical protein